MEILTAALLSVVATVGTKTLEKTGERLGDALINQTQKFLSSLKIEAPNTATAIEISPEQSIDYGRVVLEVKTVAENKPEFAQIVQELAVLAQREPNEKLSRIIQEADKSLNSQSQQATVINSQKLADSIKNVFQGNTIIGGTF